MQPRPVSKPRPAPTQATHPLTTSEKSLLAIFRKFLVRPGEMLCFDGPTVETHRQALGHLTDLGWLVKEQFRGAYSLTATGFAVMQDQQLQHD